MSLYLFIECVKFKYVYTHCSLLNLSFLLLLFCFLMFIYSHSGQSYEVRMLDNRKPGELPELNNKMVKVRGSSQLEDNHASVSVDRTLYI